MNKRFLTSPLLEEMQVNWVHGGHEQCILHILASAEENKAPLAIQSSLSGSAKTASAARLRDGLLTLKRLGLVTSDRTDRWGITNNGLSVLVEIGHPPSDRTSASPRTASAKMSELYRRPTYDGKELGPTVVRSGAYEAELLPSRMGDKLFYRDGRVEALDKSATASAQVSEGDQ